jgi:hypothetical protein
MSPGECQAYWECSLRLPRYADKKRLLRFGWKAYSQSDEDGIICEILRRIGEGTRTFIEVGVGDGTENNTLALLVNGWRGLWLEANGSAIEAVRARFADPLASQHLRAEHAFVTRDNIDELLRSHASDFGEPSVLSIDVNGNDYWVWNAIQCVRPRLVVMEYNATWHPPMSVTIQYQEQFQWKGNNYYGASLSALEKLGVRKGYSLVGCCFAGVNAFFVREDLCGRHFSKPYTAENHYEPPRYFLLRHSGHPPGTGPVEVIS